MAIKFLTNIDVAGNTVTGLAAPSANSDAATKQYVDSVAQGLDVKGSVKAASTGNLTLSGTQTVDGVALSAGDRVLAKDQTTAADKGIYVVASGAWTRATDADGANLTLGAFTFVEGGTANAGKGFVYSSTNTWTQFSESTSLTAGTGIDITGSTISVASGYTGGGSISTVGTITSGTWNGTTIGVANGGTGATTLTGYVKGDGTNALTASGSIPVTDISGRKLTGTITAATGTNTYTVDTSSLDSTLNNDAVVQLRDNSNNVLFADVTINTSDVSVTVTNNSGSSMTIKYTVLV